MKTFSVQIWQSELVEEFKVKAKSEREVQKGINEGWLKEKDPQLVSMLDKICWDGYELYIEETEE